MSRQRAGFTLVELMIVVSIIGAMALMIVPGMGEFLADARAASAAEALVRVSRHMQARVQQTGLAHMLVFTSSNDDGGLGVVRVYEGMNNYCRQTPWNSTITGALANGHTPIDVLDMSSRDYNPPKTGSERTGHVISLSVTGTLKANEAALCLEPGGAVWEGVTSTTAGAGYVFTKPRSSGGIIFTVKRKENSEERGANRAVLFSTSGIARFTF